MRKQQCMIILRLVIVFALVILPAGGAVVFSNVSSSEGAGKTDAEITFSPGSGAVTVTVPENPDQEGPGSGATKHSGALTIDAVPQFDFGKNAISRQQTYTTVKSLDDLAHFVQVSDRRGNNGGWVLQARLDKEFFEQTKTRSLGATTITLKNITATATAGALGIHPNDLPDKDIELAVGKIENIISLRANSGNFTNNISFGNHDNTLESVELFIPFSGLRNIYDGDIFTSTITWTLLSAPVSP